jgi:hypothetical protein
MRYNSQKQLLIGFQKLQEVVKEGLYPNSIACVENSRVTEFPKLYLETLEG